MARTNPQRAPITVSIARKATTATQRASLNRSSALPVTTVPSARKTRPRAIEATSWRRRVVTLLSIATRVRKASLVRVLGSEMVLEV